MLKLFADSVFLSYPYFAVGQKMVAFMMKYFVYEAGLVLIFLAKITVVFASGRMFRVLTRVLC